MSDHARDTLLRLLVSHQADIFAAADGDEAAVVRIAQTSLYSRDSVTMAAQLLASQRSLMEKR